MDERTKTAVTEAEVASEPTRVARDVIHRCNNFLSLLVALGENALAQKEAAAMEEALRHVLKESAEVEAFLRRSRRKLGN